MKKLKAFTLVECLVALLILGISALLLLQGYTQLLKVTNKNNTRYLSIADQMADAEKKDTANGYTIGDAAPTGVYQNKGHDLIMIKAKPDTTTPENGYTAITGTDARTYKLNMTVKANKAYKNHNIQGDTENDPSKGTDTRYIYFYR